MMAAYIDEHRSRFRVGPICRVLSESLGCGFLAPLFMFNGFKTG